MAASRWTRNSSEGYSTFSNRSFPSCQSWTPKRAKAAISTSNPSAFTLEDRFVLARRFISCSCCAASCCVASCRCGIVGLLSLFFCDRSSQNNRWTNKKKQEASDASASQQALQQEEAGRKSQAIASNGKRSQATQAPWQTLASVASHHHCKMP